LAENNKSKRADHTLCHADEVFFHFFTGSIMGFLLPTARIVPNPSNSFLSNDISRSYIWIRIRHLSGAYELSKNLHNSMIFFSQGNAGERMVAA
jgi:hypothetical protein